MLIDNSGYLHNYTFKVTDRRVIKLIAGKKYNNMRIIAVEFYLVFFLGKKKNNIKKCKIISWSKNYFYTFPNKDYILSVYVVVVYSSKYCTRGCWCWGCWCHYQSLLSQCPHKIDTTEPSKSTLQCTCN